jgi:hypothetical protein
MSNGPTIVQCSDHKDQLTDSVDDYTCGRINQICDPKSNGIVVLEPGDVLKCTDRYEEAYCAHNECTYVNELERRRR